MNSQGIVYDRTKQYYLDQLEILNHKIFHFYMANKGHLTSYQLRSRLWSSEYWREGKILFKELNEHLYEKLTCEYCFTGFRYPYLKSFQLHHIDHKYNWEKMFDPDSIQLVHKACHKKIHER